MYTSIAYRQCYYSNAGRLQRSSLALRRGCQPIWGRASLGVTLSTLQIDIISRCQRGPNCLVGRIARLNDRLLRCELSQVHGRTTFRIMHRVSWPKDLQVPQYSKHIHCPSLQTFLPRPEDRFLRSIVHFPRSPNRFPSLMVHLSGLIPHSNHHRCRGGALLAAKYWKQEIIIFEKKSFIGTKCGINALNSFTVLVSEVGNVSPSVKIRLRAKFALPVVMKRHDYSIDQVIYLSGGVYTLAASVQA